jgi:hypothetical protein
MNFILNGKPHFRQAVMTGAHAPRPEARNRLSFAYLQKLVNFYQNFILPNNAP